MADEEKEKALGMIDPNIHRKFKAACGAESRTMKEVLEALITQYLKQLEQAGFSVPEPKEEEPAAQPEEASA